MLHQKITKTFKKTYFLVKSVETSKVFTKTIIMFTKWTFKLTTKLRWELTRSYDLGLNFFITRSDVLSEILSFIFQKTKRKQIESTNKGQCFWHQQGGTFTFSIKYFQGNGVLDKFLRKIPQNPNGMLLCEENFTDSHLTISTQIIIHLNFLNTRQDCTLLHQYIGKFHWLSAKHLRRKYTETLD